jgi:uncharacterized membrane protein
MRKSRCILSRLSAILAILLLAAAVRIVNVSSWPVWTDEGWSTWAASDHRFDVILDKVAHDRHPPLYFLSLSAWSSVAGESRLALRFLSIISGLLTVALVYRLSADWFDRTTCAYAALLVAILQSVVYYTQEIRHYGWLIFASCLTLLLFLRYLRRPRLGILLLYMMSVALVPYIEYSGVLLFLVHVLVGLIAWRGTLRQKLGLIVAWAGAIFLFMPWLAVALLQFRSLAQGVPAYFTTINGLFSLFDVLFGTQQLALVTGLLIIGISAIMRGVQRSVKWLAHMTIVLTGVGIFGVMAILNLTVTLLLARTVIFLIPMLALIVAYGLSFTGKRLSTALAGTVILFSLYPPQIIQPRLNSDAAARMLAADYSPGDLILIEAGWDDYGVRYELHNALGERALIQFALPWYDYQSRTKLGQPEIVDVSPALRSHRRVWIVNWFATSRLIPYLDSGGEGFQRVVTCEVPTGEQYSSFAAHTIRVYLYEQFTPDAQAL